MLPSQTLAANPTRPTFVSSDEIQMLQLMITCTLGSYYYCLSLKVRNPRRGTLNFPSDQEMAVL